jgi:hypothetical protein
MNLSLIKKTTLIISIAVLSATTSNAQDLDSIVEEVSTSIQLDEAQTKIMHTEMEKYTISLQIIFDKYEDLPEPDPQAMLIDIKHSRTEYEKALKEGIGKDKFQLYTGYVEKVKMEILTEAAGLRLLDLQKPLYMTDEQVLQMKPIMGKTMSEILALLMKYVDKPMNLRTKLKVGSAMKGIKKRFYAETEQVLTAEQIEKWKKLREDAANNQ